MAVGKQFRLGAGDLNHILDAATAEAGVVETGFDCDDRTFLQAIIAGAHARRFVDGKPEGWPVRWKKGEKLGTTDFNLVIGCNRSNLDNEYGDLGTSFRGFIDEPMMWDRALSAQEVAFLFGLQNEQTAPRAGTN